MTVLFYLFKYLEANKKKETMLFLIIIHLAWQQCLEKNILEHS